MDGQTGVADIGSRYGGRESMTMPIAEIIMTGICYITIVGMTLAGIRGVYDTFFR